jgi:4'-phosphopantetheinyl transferase
LLAAADTGVPFGGLWCFSLDVADAERAELARLLSDEEQARAARFRFEEHSRRYVVAHARLRQQLGILLQSTPADLTLASGAHGKPRIAGEQGRECLEFNLSHSGSLGLIGWTWKRAIGVDIEFWRPMSDEAALVQRYFSASEIAAYELLAPAQRTPAFFNCWTRKEAYVKAVGRGLGLPLDSFDVSLGDGANARLLRASAIGDDGRAWSLAALQLRDEVSAAVVLEGEEFRVVPA